MPKISAVINTYNEEHNLRCCLETVKWCDEIIVVDMESEDRTVEIAKEYTDKIYSYAKATVVEYARKFAVEQAIGDWVFIVDADEMVPKKLSRSLIAIAEKNEADIVDVPFKHYIMGDWVRHSGWGYTPLPRFFRPGKVIFTDTIHNCMHKATDARIIQLEPQDENCLFHFNYIDSAHFIEKLNRYTGIEACQLYEQKVVFSYFRIIKVASLEFYFRFFKGKGYRDGVRGFSLCCMMVFYRVLSYIKLWEKHQFKDDPVSARYDRIKQNVLEGWR
jgi:glycosyltransferase involved in cell wall biosynthesis